MANFRQGLAGLASGIDKTAALNMNNPNKIKPKTGKASQGVTPDFVNAAAYTEAVTMKKAAERSQQMMAAQEQQEGQQGTIAQQMQQAAVGGSPGGARQNTAGIANQMQGVMQNNAAKGKQAQKAMQKMAMQKQKPKPVMQAQGQPRPQQRPPQQGGIGAMMPQQGRPQMPQQQQQQMPVRRAAQGGLMRFQSGGTVKDRIIGELEKALKGGASKADIARDLKQLNLVGLETVPKYIAFLERMGKPEVAKLMADAPAQAAGGAPSADQLNAQPDLSKALAGIGSQKPVTEKISKPRNQQMLAQAAPTLPKREGIPGIKREDLKPTLNTTPNAATVTSADRQNYRRMNRGPAGRNKPQDETDLAILQQRQAAAVKPTMGAPRSAANIDKDTFAAKTAAFDKSQQSLGSGIAALQTKSPEARAENEAGLMAFAAEEDAMLDAGPTGATPGGISSAENADIDAQIAAQQSPAAEAGPTTRDRVEATMGSTVEAGTIDTTDTPLTDKFATEYGLQGIAKQNSQDAGDAAYKTVTEKRGLDKDGNFAKQTARQKTAEDLRNYDSSPEAKKAQKEAERRAFFTNFARTGTAGGGLEALSREKARGRKQGRASIVEQGSLAVGDEDRADTIKTSGLDQMFKSVAEANKAKQAAVTAIASMTESDMKNRRDQLTRELAANSENNRNVQAALKIISDIDYKAEAIKLEKAKVDGTVLNYASQRLKEIKDQEIEIEEGLMEQNSVQLMKLRKAANGTPEDSPQQQALRELIYSIKEQTAILMGTQGVAIVEMLGAIVGEEESAKLTAASANDQRATNDLLGLDPNDSQYIQ